MKRCCVDDLAFMPRRLATPLGAADGPSSVEDARMLDARFEAQFSCSAGLAKSHLRQANLSVYRPGDGREACEFLLDVLEEFLSEELGERATIAREQIPDQAMNADRHTVVGRVLLAHGESLRPLVVRDVEVAGVLCDAEVVVRVCVCWS